MRNLIFYTLYILLGINAGNGMNTGQQIFWDNVKTLSVVNPDNFMGSPILRLGSNDRLFINFDIISDESQYLRYRVIHCNSDWQPSRLLESEFVNGFNEAPIDDYAFSSNTYIHYVNYNITLPNENLPIIASGNYLLQVYPENQPDDIILQARFSVSEEITPVNGTITTHTDKGTDSEFQQLAINVEASALRNINPYQDLIISITQNNRPETTSFISNPLRVQGSEIIYEHSPHLIFEAGNEYRRFETVRIDYPGMHIDSVKFQNGIWNAWLKPDFERRSKNYNYDSTQHGRFKIDEYNSTEPDLAADYVMVHFSIDPGSNPPGLIFVDGDFTNHRFDDFNMMKYDWNDGLYHVSIPLKQGSYNYQYVVIPENGGFPTPKWIEGNKYETRNEYLIKVFLRAPGSRADRLIGSYTLYH